jgi:CRP-like cAMP-binding protein
MSSNKQFKGGEVLFREGDPTEHVLRLTSGKVEISRHVGMEPVVLGYVTAGEFLGEMAAIENRSHSATARAVSDGAADVIPFEHFLDRVSCDPVTARDLILRLSVRLRTTENSMVEERLLVGNRRTDSSENFDVPSIPGSQLSISAGTLFLQRLIGAKTIRIETLPFVVGRAPMPGESEPRRHPDLTVYDPAPFRLSRDHFLIARSAGHIVVHDLASTLGTIVNGRPIGRHFPSDSVELRPGENQILAGGLGSPFEFRVTVSEA